MVRELGAEYERLKQVKPEGEAEGLLRNLLIFLNDLHGVLVDITQALMTESKSEKSLVDLIQMAQSMLVRGACDMQPPFFLHLNHFLTPYLYAVHTLVQQVKHMHVSVTDKGDGGLYQVLIERRGNHTDREVLRKLSKKGISQQALELYMKELIKYSPISSTTVQVKSLVLEHFVRREVARRMREEEELASMEELVYRLPFKMKVQTLMEENKAYGDRTKEDIEKMDKEARLEIEKNFPSYFNEMQQVMFNGVVTNDDDDTFTRKKNARRTQEVKTETIFEELLSISSRNLHGNP